MTHLTQSFQNVPSIFTGKSSLSSDFSGGGSPFPGPEGWYAITLMQPVSDGGRESLPTARVKAIARNGHHPSETPRSVKSTGLTRNQTKRHGMRRRPITYRRISRLALRTEKILLDVTRINGDLNSEGFLCGIRASNRKQLVFDSHEGQTATRAPTALTSPSVARI